MLEIGHRLDSFLNDKLAQVKEENWFSFNYLPFGFTIEKILDFQI